MAILSDKDIREYLKEGKIAIEPLLDEKQIQPSSVDMRLGDEFKVFKVIRKPYIDPKDEEDIASYMESTTVDEGEAFIIHPNEFALATTLEYVKIPDDLVARVEGRSQCTLQQVLLTLDLKEKLLWKYPTLVQCLLHYILAKEYVKSCLKP